MTTRTDDLTDRLIDGSLTDAEAVELHDLLAADPGARARHLALVRLELVLRGLRTAFDFAGPTVAQIEGERVERTTAAVMSELARQPAPARGPRASRLRLWATVAALAFAVLVGVWLARPTPGPGPSPAGPSDEPRALARLITVSGAVEVADPSGSFAARPDQVLTPGHTLRTVSEESAAVVEFADGTRIELHPETVVRFAPVAAAERRVQLVEGRVTATATGQRLVVGTGATDVEASRGSFSLWSSGAGSARVESMDSDVRVVGGAPAAPVLVASGRAAFVRDDQTPVRVEPALAVQTEPRARLNFMALDVRFAPDGEVWAASAKQWAKWAPGAPDPGRTLVAPRTSNDGLASWLTPDLSAVAICRVDDRDDRVTVRALPSGDERGRVPVRVSEPRFLCVGPDASWVATAGGPKPNNRTVRVWTVDTGTERFARELPNGVNCLAASPDGKRLAVGVSDLGRGHDNGIAVIDAATGDRVCDLPTARKGVYALAFSADGRHLAAGFNGVIQVWDVPARKLVRALEGFERVVTRLTFDPRGDLLAAGTQDGQVWVWSAPSGARRQVIETGARGVRAVAFSADGKQLVTATNKAGVAVWDVAPEPPKSGE